jgi:hypothetical protein
MQYLKKKKKLLKYNAGVLMRIKMEKFSFPSTDLKCTFKTCP